MYNELMSIADENKGYIRKLFHHFHMYPELSGVEYNTAESIRRELTKLGLNWRAIGTGTVAEIPSDGRRPLVALRADIDALPISEKNTFEHVSKNVGIMHACGHDSHIAMLLGAAKIMSENRNKLSGPVRLIFQPAEEKGGGSHGMIAGGALDGVAEIYCLHAGPGIETGKLVTRPGVVHASSDGIRITVRGESAHGSVPHMGTDAIVIASHIVIALQELISRETASWEQAVLTIGAFHGGTARNIVCDNVVMDATLRTLSESVRLNIHKRICEICEGIAKVMRGSAEVEFVQKYCSNINDSALTEKAIKCAKEYFGDDGYALLDKPSMEGEDFGAYQQIVPGVKLYIGTGCENRLHTDCFHIDENMLHIGAAFMAALCIESDL